MSLYIVGSTKPGLRLADVDALSRKHRATIRGRTEYMKTGHTSP